MSSDHPILEVIAGNPDKPLVIAGVKVQCYVLEGGIRVLSQGGILTALGRHRVPDGGVENLSTNTPSVVSAKNLQPFISDTMRAVEKPLRFTAPDWGGIGVGFRAELLPEVCNVYLDARRAGALRRDQLHIAERAEILLRALAVVGIIGLVDEATQFQLTRGQQALAKILEQYLSDEFKPWTRTFPYEFYEEIVRLKGWPSRYILERPHEVARITIDDVYDRIAPGIRRELEVRNPRLPSGQRAQKHHQWFTVEYGHPKLQLHLEGVMVLMRTSLTYDHFERSLRLAYPKPDSQLPFREPYSQN